MHLKLKRKNSTWFEGLGRELGSRLMWYSGLGTRFEIGVNDWIRGLTSKSSFWMGVRGQGWDQILT